MALLAAAQRSGGLYEDPAFVAGHSMGEYTALAAAGALEFEAGLRLVRTRGEVTQRAADATPGGMAAILGLDEEATAAVCAEAGAELCNINSPGQIVIGGRPGALERACALAIERGARRAVPLDVTGAFHTSLMEPAAPAMRDAVAQAGLVAPRVPIVLNREASAVSDPSTIGEELVTQLTSPVRWQRCVEYLAAQGVTEFVEIGPGRVLTGLVKRIAPEALLRNVNGVSSTKG
jgi:[acyl-carrier-protein] S-malonyltransferase